jgi:hypothetical protein
MTSLTATDTGGGSVHFIIRWIEQRGVGTYEIGWMCV